MAPPTTIDVATVNLWGANGPARARMDDLASWLGRERPDIVLLQEVEQLDGRDQADWLAGAAGYDHVDGIRVGEGSEDGEGLTVLSRHPLMPLPPVLLPEAPSDHPRGLQQADVETPAGTVRIANTHLAWQLDATPARADQAQTIAQTLQDPGLSVLLGGDLNDVPGSPALRILETAGFTDCCSPTSDPAPTFDRSNEFLWQTELAGRRVDHLLARGPEITDAHVVLDGRTGPIVSDHYGVRVTVRFPR